MNHEIHATNHTRKCVTRLTAKNTKLYEKLQKTLEHLSANPNYPGLKSHKILSKRTGKFEFSSWVDGELRLIWNYGPGDHIILLDFGSHKDIYQ